MYLAGKYATDCAKDGVFVVLTNSCTSLCCCSIQPLLRLSLLKRWNLAICSWWNVTTLFFTELVILQVAVHVKSIQHESDRITAYCQIQAYLNYDKYTGSTDMSNNNSSTRQLCHRVT